MVKKYFVFIPDTNDSGNLDKLKVRKSVLSFINNEDSGSIAILEKRLMLPTEGLRRLITESVKASNSTVRSATKVAQRLNSEFNDFRNQLVTKEFDKDAISGLGAAFNLLSERRRKQIRFISGKVSEEQVICDSNFVNCREKYKSVKTITSCSELIQSSIESAIIGAKYAKSVIESAAVEFDSILVIYEPQDEIVFRSLELFGNDSKITSTSAKKYSMFELNYLNRAVKNGSLTEEEIVKIAKLHLKISQTIEALPYELNEYLAGLVKMFAKAIIKINDNYFFYFIS